MKWRKAESQKPWLQRFRDKEDEMQIKSRKQLMSQSWLDTLQLRFLTGPIIPTTAPFWSSMQNSQNIVLASGGKVVCCVAQSDDAAARALQSAAVLIREPRGKRADEEESSNDGIREIWEIRIAILTFSHTVVVSALFFCLNLFSSCKLTQFNTL